MEENKKNYKWKIIKYLIILVVVVYAAMHWNECEIISCTERIPYNEKYCEKHRGYTHRSRTRSTYTSPSTKSNSSSSSSSSNSHSSSSSSSSYDDAYDDYYYDGDYDTDRYESDSDYADGIDDVMDEYGDDW